jgi:Flp pilus assembly pilin Flp
MTAISRILKRQAGATPREFAFIAALLGFSAFMVVSVVSVDIRANDEIIAVR